MKVTHPIKTSEGDEYLVLIESMAMDTLFDEEDIAFLNGVNLVEITLERVSGNHKTTAKVLTEISQFIAGVINDNSNSILYFYCDDMHDIPRRDKSTSPQKFRSNLFSRMFDRYITSNGIDDYINTPLEIKADRSIYIHLISRRQYQGYVDCIKSRICSMSK